MGRTSFGGRKNGGQPWGPDNPHPLSTLKTELVWDGKYDEYGNRREVDVAGAAFPMQRIETIDRPLLLHDIQLHGRWRAVSHPHRRVEIAKKELPDDGKAAVKPWE